MLFFKTQKGTLSAKRWEEGISVGFYGKESFCSVETTDSGKVVLLVNDDICKEHGVEVIRTDKNWRGKSA